MSKRKIGICECGSNRRYVALRNLSIRKDDLYRPSGRILERVAMDAYWLYPCALSREMGKGNQGMPERAAEEEE